MRNSGVTRSAADKLSHGQSPPRQLPKRMTNATTHDSLEDRVTGARPCLSGGHAGRTGMPLRAAGQGAALRPARCSLGRGAALTGPRDSLVGEEQGVTGSARDRSRLLWARVCRRGRVGLPGCPEGVSKEASASGLLSRLPPAPPSPEECGAGPPGSCCPRGRAAPAEGTSRTWKRRVPLCTAPSATHGDSASAGPRRPPPDPREPHL